MKKKNHIKKERREEVDLQREKKGRWKDRTEQKTEKEKRQDRKTRNTHSFNTREKKHGE
jgi:hypothetical protein